MYFNDDAKGLSDPRQPYHIVDGKILTQQEWDLYIYGEQS